jgi:manganese/iron transport system substrate-binding protein
VLYSGYEFEPSLIKLITASSSSAPKVAVGEAAVPQPLIGEYGHEHGHEHGHKEEKAAGEKAEAHAEEEPDPHV